MVHALQFAMPNEFGSDHLPETRPLVRVVWSNQFPFGVLGTHGGLWRHERTDPAASPQGRRSDHAVPARSDWLPAREGRSARPRPVAAADWAWRQL